MLSKIQQVVASHKRMVRKLQKYPFEFRVKMVRLGIFTGREAAVSHWGCPYNGLAENYGPVAKRHS